MSLYKIIFSPTAEKQMLKLPSHISIRIANAIANLANRPFLGKKLKGDLTDYRSYRVGDYRVIYFIRRAQVQVEIIRVANRREVYR
jgi:mRNA interferase RelE/StbE